MADLVEILFEAVAEILFEAVSQDGSQLTRGLQDALNEKSDESIIKLDLSV
jgi:hypothetical protein